MTQLSPIGLTPGNPGGLNPEEQQIYDAINAQLAGGGGDGGGGGGGGGGRRGGGRGGGRGKGSVSLLTPQDIVNSFTGKGGDIVSNLGSALQALHLKQQADLNAYAQKYGKQASSSTVRGSYETAGNRGAMADLANALQLQMTSIGNTAAADWSKANEAYQQNMYAAMKSGVSPLNFLGEQWKMLMALNPNAPGSQSPTYAPLTGNFQGTGQGMPSGTSPLFNVAAGLGPQVAGTWTNTTGAAANALNSGANRSWAPNMSNPAAMMSHALKQGGNR